MNNCYIEEGANRCLINGKPIGMCPCSFAWYNSNMTCVHYRDDECHCYAAIEAAGMGDVS